MNRAAGELKRVLEIFALPGDEALEHVPPGPHRAEQLALRFDEAYTNFVASLTSLPSDAQLASLQAVDAQLHSMSDPELGTLWEDPAVRGHPQWERLRLLVSEALRELGW